MPASRILYEMLAKTIKRRVDEVGPLYLLTSLVDDICDDLKQENIHFNKDKFKKACGLC